MYVYVCVHDVGRFVEWLEPKSNEIFYARQQDVYDVSFSFFIARERAKSSALRLEKDSGTKVKGLIKSKKENNRERYIRGWIRRRLGALPLFVTPAAVSCTFYCALRCYKLGM